MPTTEEILAKEALIRDLRAKCMRLEGEVNATAAVMPLLSLNPTAAKAAIAAMNEQGRNSLAQARMDLAATEALGSSALDKYGKASDITEILLNERQAGKRGTWEAVQADPECSEEAAVAAWTAAALASTGLPTLTQDPLALAGLYRERLVRAGLAEAPTWEGQRAWMLATPLETVLGL